MPPLAVVSVSAVHVLCGRNTKRVSVVCKNLHDEWRYPFHARFHLLGSNRQSRHHATTDAGLQSMEDAGTNQSSTSTLSEYGALDGSGADLASLPDGVRAILEECRAQSKTSGAPAAPAAKGAPYPCRMYEEAGPGEEDMLQLQWMRVDVSGKPCVHSS